MALKASANKKLFWVVVADEACAVVYGHESKSGPLSELFTLKNDIARMKASELISDRGGRSFDSGGEGRHTMGQQKNDPRRQAAKHFAKSIAERIGKASHAGTCRDFALVAAPRFLGELRTALATMSKVEPYLEIDKDLVTADAATIRKLMTSA